MLCEVGTFTRTENTENTRIYTLRFSPLLEKGINGAVVKVKVNKTMSENFAIYLNIIYKATKQYSLVFLQFNI